ncbi:MAG: hypothetical protein F6K65_35015 [Moorea sp. SIO3C2]|nr:hypothetical protein [Moorena sp. SIO3C2]
MGYTYQYFPLDPGLAVSALPPKYLDKYQIELDLWMGDKFYAIAKFAKPVFLKLVAALEYPVATFALGIPAA